MNRPSSAAIRLLTLFAVSLPVPAKGDMVLVEIMGGKLQSTIRITDPKIQYFNIWAGPGVNSASLEDGQGFIINWKAGAVPQQSPLQVERYQVAFYAGCLTDDSMCRGAKPHLAYVVLYDYDPKSGQGFVYLPNTNESWGNLNGGSIYRGSGIEGHWFHATDAWRSFVQPIIAKATSAVPVP